MPKPKTAAQVKAGLHQSGTTVTQWAKDNHFPRTAVYQVLNGYARGHHGQAYQIAVALGMIVPTAQNLAA